MAQEMHTDDDGGALARAMGSAIKPDGLRWEGLGDTAAEISYGRPGRALRVCAHTQPSGRAAVNVTGWVMPEAYPVDPTRAYDRMTFLAKHGPDGCAEYKLGLPDLTPSQALELAEALVVAALAVEDHQLDPVNDDVYR